jgi:hypothetical protein
VGTGQSSDPKRIEGVRAVKIDNGFAGQGSLSHRIEGNSKGDRMPVKNYQSVVRTKRNVRLSKRQKPVLQGFAFPACGCVLMFRFNEWQCG